MRFIILAVLGVGLFLLNLFVGSVKIPAGEVMDILLHGDAEQNPLAFIILGSR